MVCKVYSMRAVFVVRANDYAGDFEPERPLFKKKIKLNAIICFSLESLLLSASIRLFCSYSCICNQLKAIH